jgi:DNA primase
MAIPQSFIQELLARVDIVEIVGRHVQLKKGGANFMGLCPFHGEKSPSFSVSPTKQFFHCFGCGKNGNAIGFLMDHVGMNFVEAVQSLAQQFGMQVPESNITPEERALQNQLREKQSTLTDVLQLAGQAYRKQLRQAPRAVEYLKSRGLSGEIAQRFGLGYAPDAWRHLASVFPHYDQDLLVESGLVILHEAENKRYDRFRDRIMFPIRNIKGECIGFGGRVLGEGTPKYLNSPETPVFSKGRELYGLFEARQAIHERQFALVTEGYMDVVALAQLGYPNAVATLGTACTPEHVQKLFRFTDAVVFSFDGDAAGRRAARKALDGALPYANDVRSVKFLFLPAEHDPDSYIRTHGQEAFAQCIADAMPLSLFLMEAAKQACDLNTAEGRARMASQARPMWQLLPDGTFKQQILIELADLIQLGTHELLALWQPEMLEHPRSPAHPHARPDRGSVARTETPSSTTSRNNWNAPPGGVATRRPRGIHHHATREDRALHLIFTDALTWDSLSNEQHTLLCALPAPHGPLFCWLDAQLHEHGPQPWAALREGLRGAPHEHHLVSLIDNTLPHIQNDATELLNVLRELEKAQLGLQMNQLAPLAATDAAARTQMRTLSSRLSQLKAHKSV